MVGKQPVTLVGAPQDRLEQIERDGRTRYKPGLEQAFIVFILGLRSDRHSAPYVQPEFPLVFIRNQRAYCDAEGSRTVGTGVYDRTGIHSTRLILQLIDDPHCLDLRSPRDRAA